MTFASEGSYAYTDFTQSHHRQVRPTPSVKGPRLVGWRLDPSEQPHVRKIIRKINRRSNEASEYFYETLVELVVGKPARHHEAKNTKEHSTWNKEKQKADRDLLREFQTCAERWRKETAIFSSVSDIVLNPSYQRIIGMGPDVVPLILRDLEKTNDHWFWALEAITGHNPITEEDRGRVKKMAKRWLDWGKAEQVL